MIIFLIGARGSGKTTVGRMLANKLGFSLRDTDALITKKAGCTIADIVSREGWDSFRAREGKALVKAAKPDRVIATGGGMVLAEANRALMRDSGIVFYLEASAEALHERLSLNLHPEQRPSLTGGDPLQEIASVLQQREPLYRAAAHYNVDATLSPAEVAAAIVKLIEGHKQCKGAEAHPVAGV